MTEPAYQREQRRLADTLRQWRTAASDDNGRVLSGAALAARCGWAQPKVSKIENLRQLPGEEDIRTWGRHTGQDETAIAAAIAMLPAARVEHAEWRSAYDEAGTAGVQAEIRSLEEASTRIAEWQPGMISGLLHTPEYARESLRVTGGPLDYGRTEEDLDATVAERIRRQNVLYDRDKQVRIVMAEAALRAGVVSLDTLAGQLDRLTAVIGLPGVVIGIIPDFRPMPHWPFGFRLYDALAIAESSIGETQYSKPEDIARHEKIMDALVDAAATGSEAIALIHDTISKIRAIQDRNAPETA